MKFIDLFCGIGSFHASLKALGWTCVFASDINEDARKTYFENHALQPAGDICDIEAASVPAFDVLCAGFPCQPFSVAGHQKGFSDKRGDMFFQLMRFVEYHKPVAVILENVAGLLKHDAGNTYRTIVQKLTDTGYTTCSTILTCSDYGIPQMRKRLFIVAMRIPFPDTLLNFDHQKETRILSEFLNAGRAADRHVTLQKQVSYTIRCGGKNSPIDDGHNWDGSVFHDYACTLYCNVSTAGCSNMFGFCGGYRKQ